MEVMEERLRVGVISSTHGIRGEVKVFPTTDDVTRFKKLKSVFFVQNEKEQELEIEGVKFFKKFAILKFKGIDNINDVESFRGGELYIPRSAAKKPAKNEYFIVDLIGIKVSTEEGRFLGELTDVIETGANDVYSVTMEDGKELLLPAIKQCILNVDLEKKEMTIHLMKGLLDE